jgi:hypothetical protein
MPPTRTRADHVAIVRSPTPSASATWLCLQPACSNSAPRWRSAACADPARLRASLESLTCQAYQQAQSIMVKLTLPPAHLPFPVISGVPVPGIGEGQSSWGSAVLSLARADVPSFRNTLCGGGIRAHLRSSTEPRYSAVRALMNRRAPMSRFVSASRARRATLSVAVGAVVLIGLLVCRRCSSPPRWSPVPALAHWGRDWDCDGTRLARAVAIFQLQPQTEGSSP